MVGKLGAAVVIFVYAIILFVLVRPGSQGPSLVGQVGSAIKGIIQAGTGGGTWAKA